MKSAQFTEKNQMQYLSDQKQIDPVARGPTIFYFVRMHLKMLLCIECTLFSILRTACPFNFLAHGIAYKRRNCFSWYVAQNKKQKTKIKQMRSNSLLCIISSIVSMESAVFTKICAPRVPLCMHLEQAEIETAT